MARRPRRATPRELPESRYLASRIQDAKRRGATDRQIGEAFGINERTVRKIRSGETPGTRVYRAKIETPAEKSSPSIVRVDIAIGTDSAGDPVYRTINAKVPALTSASGKRVAPTPFDVFRLPNMQEVAIAEGKRMRNLYGVTGGKVEISTIRPIVRRDPRTKLHTITGRYDVA